MDYKSNAFPVGKGKVNLTTGTFGGGVFLCVVDGDLLVTWADDTTDTLSLTAGDAINAVRTAKTVGIVSGTFHIA